MNLVLPFHVPLNCVLQHGGIPAVDTGKRMVQGTQMLLQMALRFAVRRSELSAARRARKVPVRPENH